MNAVSLRWYSTYQGSIGDLSEPKFHFRLADGSKVKNHGSIELDFEVLHTEGRYKSSARFQVMESADEWEILLGKPWLMASLAVVDYGKDTLTLQDNIGIYRFKAEEGNYSVDNSNERAFMSIEGEEVFAENVVPHVPVPKHSYTPERVSDIKSKIKIGPLSPEQRKRVDDVIEEYHDAFALDISEVPCCPHTEHTLTVDPSIKLTRKPFGRPLSEPEMIAAKEQVDKLLAGNVIERCIPEDVECCSPIVIASKPMKGEEVDIDTIQRLADEALRRAGLPSMHSTKREGLEKDVKSGPSPPLGDLFPSDTSMGGGPSHVATVSPNRSDVHRKTSTGKASIAVNSDGILKSGPSPPLDGIFSNDTSMGGGPSHAHSVSKNNPSPDHENVAGMNTYIAEHKPSYRMCHNFTQINKATTVVPFPRGH